MRKENRLVSRKGLGLGWMIASILLGCCIGNAFAAPANSPVLLLGDSMMKLPSLAIERELAKTQPSVKAISFATIGTGLARLDAFDWLGKIDELCAQEHPKMAVVALGANDRQPMQLPSGGIVALGSPEWKTEYTHRIKPRPPARARGRHGARRHHQDAGGLQPQPDPRRQGAGHLAPRPHLQDGEVRPEAASTQRAPHHHAARRSYLIKRR